MLSICGLRVFGRIVGCVGGLGEGESKSETEKMGAKNDVGRTEKAKPDQEDIIRERVVFVERAVRRVAQRWRCFSGPRQLHYCSSGRAVVVEGN